MLGPGKAELLQGIAETGSISAAGRRMEMSYKRAWMLVEEMNAAFRAPLVESVRGGPGGGGARLTDTGAEVLRRYRAVEAVALQAAEPEIAALEALLRPGAGTDMSDGK
ncbi:MAG: LysR family transcriptional regulator [Rhodobacteraceae bacterium]|nr:LysR family transcriptional regulator [Paracoccaceae bacterium]